jgi:hypothetical protein
LHPGSGEEAWSRGSDGVHPDLQADEVHPGREPDGDRPGREPDEVHPGREPDGDRPGREPDEIHPAPRGAEHPDEDHSGPEPDEVPDAQPEPRSTGCCRRAEPWASDEVHRALRRSTVPPEQLQRELPVQRELPESDEPASEHCWVQPAH